MDHRKIQSKAELKQQLSLSRQAIDLNLDSLRHEMDFAYKVKKSINDYPVLWGAGAFIGAFALIKLILPSKKPIILHSPNSSPAPLVTKRQSRVSSLLSFAFGLVSPQIRNWAAETAKEQLHILKDKCIAKYLPK